MWSSPWNSVDKRMNEKEMGVGGQMGPTKNILFLCFYEKNDKDCWKKEFRVKGIISRIKAIKA